MHVAYVYAVDRFTWDADDVSIQIPVEVNADDAHE